MNYMKCSKALHKEANRILYQDGLDKIIRKYGDINYTGSYRLDLMACGDIDISMIMSEYKFSLDKFFQMGNEIAKLDGTTDMRFQNFFKITVEGLPKGFYWGIKYKSNASNRSWKIDLWAVDEDTILQNKLYIDKVIEQLNDENRRIIINTKYSILNKDGRMPPNSGYYIYKM